MGAQQKNPLNNMFSGFLIEHFKIFMKIRNIIFDLGGVLLDINYTRTERAFIDLGCKDFHAIYSQARQTALFDDFERGKITETAFFEELKVLSGLKHISHQKLKTAWNAMLIGFPEESYKLLKNLKTKYRIFLLSNNNETHVKFYEKMIEKVCPVKEFENLFENFHYSYRMGLKKPDAACFLHVLTENNLNAAETIFIDDTIQHVEGAAKTGIKAYWLEQPMTTENLLKELQLI